MTIRKKLFIAMLVLGVAVITLAYSGVRGVFAYRDLAVTVSHRAAELPTTARLTQAVDSLYFSFQTIHPKLSLIGAARLLEDDTDKHEFQFRERLLEVSQIVGEYQRQLTSASLDDPFLSDRTHEQQTVTEINELLTKISTRHAAEGVIDPTATLMQRNDLKTLRERVQELPTYLQSRMVSFRNDMRSHYRTWIIITLASTTFATGLLIGLLVYTKLVVIRPFKELLQGARQVAAGDFHHRIDMDSGDELAELAAAINMATTEFLKIQYDLNDKVRERSREVIRNEQLASVGFLAAGVAHEINNPLASIAWSAEALESRLHRILHPMLSPADRDPEAIHGESASDALEPISTADLDTLRTYLRRIQDEAFRCKGITESLLDFSRLGQAEKKQQIEMNSIIEDVIGMVRHLGQYRSRNIRFDSKADIEACASPQEMKQVVLNLVTNGLDALGPEQIDGYVAIRLESDSQFCKLFIEDNGCGMTPEVQEHLFEPFFTRRRDGRGTGLGLPICSRIIADHGGRIIVSSPGENLGARFEVHIPRLPSIQTNNHVYHKKAA